jgi:hypothetical protein
LSKYELEKDMRLWTEEEPLESFKNGTLEHFHNKCAKEGTKHILNKLDPPMGAAELPAVVQYQRNVDVPDLTDPDFSPFIPHHGILSCTI